MADDADQQVKAWLGGPADVVLSDMAAASTGHQQTDHLRIVALCEAAAHLAFDVLVPGGTFVAKVLAGGAEGSLQKLLKQKFTKVENVKPPASRSDSSEKFVVATGFRGRDVTADAGGRARDAVSQSGHSPAASIPAMARTRPITASPSTTRPQDGGFCTQRFSRSSASGFM